MLNVKFRAHRIPDGQYSVTITSVEEVTANGAQLIRITTRIESPQPGIDGMEISMLADPDMSGESRLARWYEAAMHVLLREDGEVDLEEMVGKTVIIAVKNRPTASGVMRSQIVAVLACD